MKNDAKRQKKTFVTKVIINISGGNTQIMPNATKGEQNSYGTEFAPAKIQGGLSEDEGDEDEIDVLRIARGTLCIYYPDKAKLIDIIRRIADCRNASDLANLVVNDMRKNTILTEERMVSKDFIWALQQFVTFKSGASTGNIRAQINKVRTEIR